MSAFAPAELIWDSQLSDAFHLTASWSPPPDNAPHARPADPPPSMAKCRVLLVEDDSTSANALRVLLNYRGYEVTVVETVADALAAMRDGKFDRMILDLMLPDGDGTALLQHVRETNLPTRVIVTTALNDTARVAEIRNLAPDRILRKPINLAELLRGLSGKGLQ